MKSILRTCCTFLVITLLCTGCLDATFLVVMQPDGSGTISYQAEANRKGLAQFSETIGLLSMMRFVNEADIAYSLGLSSDELSPESLKELYTKERMAELASILGQGVELLRYQPVDANGKQGFRALYRFDDINALRLGPGADPASVGPDWMYRFSYKKGAPNKLTLVPPVKVTGFSAESTASALDPVIEGLRMMPNADGFVNHLFSGGHLRIAVQVPGTVVEGEEHVTSGNTVILAEVDANRVPGGSTILEVLSIKDPKDMLDLYEARTSGITLAHPTEGVSVSFE